MTNSQGFADKLTQASHIPAHKHFSKRVLASVQANSNTKCAVRSASHQSRINPCVCGTQGSDGFVIKHYAGDVRYSATGFGQSNMDALGKDATLLLQVPVPTLGSHGIDTV